VQKVGRGGGPGEKSSMGSDYKGFCPDLRTDEGFGL